MAGNPLCSNRRNILNQTRLPRFLGKKTCMKNSIHDTSNVSFCLLHSSSLYCNLKFKLPSYCHFRSHHVSFIPPFFLISKALRRAGEERFLWIWNFVLPPYQAVPDARNGMEPDRVFTGGVSHPHDMDLVIACGCWYGCCYVCGGGGGGGWWSWWWHMMTMMMVMLMMMEIMMMVIRRELSSCCWWWFIVVFFLVVMLVITSVRIVHGVKFGTSTCLILSSPPPSRSGHRFF